MRVIIILLTVFWVKVATAQTPQKISYVYDDLNRLSTVTYPNGTQVVYTYDALGNRQTQVVTNGACTPPPAPSVSSATINSGQTATLTATCPNGGIVRWYDVPTGGNVIYFQPNQITFTTPPLTATRTYYATCSPVGCESDRGSGTVTVNSGCTPPAAPTFTGSFSTNNYTRWAITANGCSGLVKWYRNSTDTSPFFTGNPLSTPILFSTTTYYASCTVGSCESSKTPITVTVNPCITALNQGTGVLGGNLYQAQTITSQRNVSDRTFFRASQSITLNAGFQAGANELFLAEIGGCATMPESGLLAYYPFNGGSTNDETPNNNHAINNGATLGPDRRNAANSAYYFNGTNAWMNTPMVQSNLSGYTVSAWVKPEFTANQEYVILQNRGASPGSGHSLTLHYQASTGRWCFAVDGDGLYTGVQAPSPNTTNWIHVVGVWSSGGATSFSPGQFKVYVNGVLLSAILLQGNAATIPNTGAGTVAIGRHQAWNSFFKGWMDDIRVYNRALTAQEVQNIYVIER